MYNRSSLVLVFHFHLDQLSAARVIGISLMEPYSHDMICFLLCFTLFFWYPLYLYFAQFSYKIRIMNRAQIVMDWMKVTISWIHFLTEVICR
jgi:hypothetical protein